MPSVANDEAHNQSPEGTLAFTTASSTSGSRSLAKRQGIKLQSNRPAKRQRGEASLSRPNTGSTSETLTSVAIFSGAQTAQAIGGTYTVVGRDHITVHNYYGHPGSEGVTPQHRKIQGKIRADTASCVSRPGPSSPRNEETFPEMFPRIQQSIEFIKQLIQPHSHPEGSCHGVSHDLHELDELVNISSLAYQAFDSRSLVGRVLRSSIDSRMLQCKTVLMGVHQDMITVLHRPLPLVPLIFRIIHRWWTGSEPREIAAARLALNSEAKGVGKWLCDLKLFHWAESLLRSGKSGFSWRMLDDFFRSGPNLLREIHVEKIIIIEPLQGEALSLPLCFAESFEDVHQIVKLACQGTKGSRFIEDRHYQLDESMTNLTVQPSLFHEFMHDGRAFEVTMLIQALSLMTTDCPRCGHRHDQSQFRQDDWIRCKGCHTIFNSQIFDPATTPSTSRIQEVEMDEGETDVSSENPTHDKPASTQNTQIVRPSQQGVPRAPFGTHQDDGDNGHGVSLDVADPWTLFRRMKIEILSPAVNFADLGIEGRYNNAPPEYRTHGLGWFAVHNPQLKRRLDIELVHSFQHESVVCCVHFSQDGRFVATGCNQTAQIFDTKSGLKIYDLLHESETHTGDLYIRSVRFSPDGKLLATGAEDRQIRIWDIARERIREVFDGHQQEIYSLDFSRDGRLIVSGSGDRTTHIWDMDEPNRCKVFTDVIDVNTDAGVTSVAISPSACLVAAGSLDNMIRIWDVNTGQLLERLRGHTNSVYSVAFTPDGKGLVTGSLDKTLKLWDVSHLNSVEGRRKAADNPDQRDQVERERMERMEREGMFVQSANCVMDFIGHKDYVLEVSASSDSRWVVSGSKDRCVHVWDSCTATLQLMLQGHKNSVISLDLNSNSGYDLLATGSGDSVTRIWRLEKLK